MYDPLSRLLSGTVPLAETPRVGMDIATQSYSYDPFGNIRSIVTSPALQTDRAAISVDTASNRVTDAGFAYDDAGNMTQDAGVAFAWDSIGTMRSKTEAPWRQEVYLYAPGGERIATFNLTNGTSTRTLRDLDGRVLRELTGGGPGGATLTFSRDYVYRGDALLASESGEGQRHFHLDHLGTPRLITNASGQREAYHSYYPFGQEATSKAQDMFRLKFTGHERDFAVPGGASDLDYMHARYYSPLLGRFVSVDRISGQPIYPQSFNLFAYVAGNPLNSVDPSGLMTITVTAPDPDRDRRDREARWAEFNRVHALLRLWNPVRSVFDVGSAREYYEQLSYDAAADGNMAGSFANELLLTALPESQAGLLGEVLMSIIPGPLDNAAWAGVKLLGRNARFAKRGAMTDLSGGRSAAKSLFRNLTKGKKIGQNEIGGGSLRRFTSDNKVSIRFNADGTTRIDVVHANGRMEVIHFGGY